jgi:hypothetical protein
MTPIRVAGIAALLLALFTDISFAQSKKNNGTTASVAGMTCTTGQTCSANCDAVGWCSRMVCSGNKWEKRLVSCVGSLCPPRC